MARPSTLLTRQFLNARVCLRTTQGLTHREADDVMRTALAAYAADIAGDSIDGPIAEYQLFVLALREAFTKKGLRFAPMKRPRPSLAQRIKSLAQRIKSLAQRIRSRWRGWCAAHWSAA